MIPDLKSCPFCSRKAKAIVKSEKLASGENYIDFTISCLGCGVAKNVRMKYGIHGASFFDVEKAMDEVVSAWNRRGTNG
jgi:hypothetical protein